MFLSDVTKAFVEIIPRISFTVSTLQSEVDRQHFSVAEKFGNLASAVFDNKNLYRIHILFPVWIQSAVARGAAISSNRCYSENIFPFNATLNCYFSLTSKFIFFSQLRV